MRRARAFPSPLRGGWTIAEGDWTGGVAANRRDASLYKRMKAKRCRCNPTPIRFADRLSPRWGEKGGAYE